MSQPIQLRRSTTPSTVPGPTDLLPGECAINLADKNFYYGTGSEAVQLNAASNIVTDTTHRFITDSQITGWNTAEPAATTSALGEVIIGGNIDVTAGGTISIKTASATDTGVLTSTDWSAFNGKQAALGYTPVNKAGDSMSGPLVLSGAPTLDPQAANKKYVDDGLALKLNLSGGTLTGTLVLAGDPTAGLQPTTKQYVDNAVDNVGGSYAPPTQDLTGLAALVSTLLVDKQMRLVEDEGAIFRYDTASTATPDGSDVILPGDVLVSSPGRWVKVQAATQNHNILRGLQGGASNNYLHLTSAEKNGYDAHLVDMTMHLTSSQNTFLDALTVSSTEINYLGGVTSNIQTQLNGTQASLGYTPVNKAGDSMLGMLSLFADPTSSMQATTKNYVDTRTIDGGTF